MSIDGPNFSFPQGNGESGKPKAFLLHSNGFFTIAPTQLVLKLAGWFGAFDTIPHSVVLVSILAG